MKKSIFKTIGIIALAVVIGLSMAGCKEDPEVKPPYNIMVLTYENADFLHVFSGLAVAAPTSASDGVVYDLIADNKKILDALDKIESKTYGVVKLEDTELADIQSFLDNQITASRINSTFKNDILDSLSSLDIAVGSYYQSAGKTAVITLMKNKQ